jgi:CheY-like chemotaxis protein
MGCSVQRAASPPLKDRRILVVEDDWFIANAVADLLAKEGATVFGPASTVAEGAQLAEYWPIEIAVMDLNLNGQRADDLVVAQKDITVAGHQATGRQERLRGSYEAGHLRCPAAHSEAGRRFIGTSPSSLSG